MRILSFSLFYATTLLCYVSLSPRLSTATISGNETDRLALLAFKCQITLDPFNVFSSWNDSNHFCEWAGVTCSTRHQRVTILSLRSIALVGSITPHIGNLSFLKIISLRNNSFHGEIPREVGQLSRLEVFNVSRNSLVGEIPASISLCSNLIYLYVGYNKLVGKIPVELGSLSKLVHLDLEDNLLTGGIPPSLGNLTSLETIFVTENFALGGSIPSTLGQLKNLETLALESSNLSGMFPPSLYNLSALQHLTLSNNPVSGNLPTNIGLMFPNLQLFLIWGTKFSGSIPVSLFNISKLQTIDMGDNQFTGEVPRNVGNMKELRLLRLHANELGSGKPGDLDFFTSLTNCTNLQYFSISKNQFGGELPTSVANFSNQLSEFHVYGNQISGNIPSEIENLQNLIRLDLSLNFFTGNIPPSFTKLQNLGVLNLSSNHLSGMIPSSIWNMSQLFFLDLSRNILEGNIRPSLDNKILQFLDLSYNNFTGSIPYQEIGLSTHLITLSLTHNSLNGSIPSEVGNLKSLNSIDVSENKMSGEIPNTLGSCSSLEYLHLQGNFFQGPLPSSFGSLKGLQVMDVSRNKISGEIPKELEKLSDLHGLNLSFNNLEGEVPMNGIFRNASAFSVFGNQKICGGIPNLGFPKCHIQKSKKQRVQFILKVTLGVLIPLVVVALCVVLYLRINPKATPHSEQTVRDLKNVSYHDLHKATDGFSSANLIGVGSYGSVYKGILHQDRRLIAVKVINLIKHGASKSFVVECEALKVIRHRNLLKILTVCSSVDLNGNDFKALVFEFMPNGSLESWLHPSSDGHLPRSLNLHQRISIAVDIAFALDYLHNHCEQPIVHCDLKPSNVLLNDDLIAHVGDFGLAKFLSTTESTSTSSANESNTVGLRGTIGYIPPEYGTRSEVSRQGDMYSYGILLLEMFTAKRPTAEMFKDGLSLHSFSKTALPKGVMDIIDLCLLSESSKDMTITSVNRKEECLTSIIRIGVACSVEQMTERMEIKNVLKEMHSIKEAFLQA